MRNTLTIAGAALLCVVTLPFSSPASAQGAFVAPFRAPRPIFSKAVAFDVSPSVRSLPRSIGVSPFAQFVREIRPENDDGPFVRNVNLFRDPVVQRFFGNDSGDRLLGSFEGLKNTENPAKSRPRSRRHDRPEQLRRARESRVRRLRPARELAGRSDAARLALGGFRFRTAPTIRATRSFSMTARTIVGCSPNSPHADRTITTASRFRRPPTRRTLPLRIRRRSEFSGLSEIRRLEQFVSDLVA